MAGATFAAMALARTLGGARIVIVQAAASAILTVAVADGEAGFDRLLDACIGAGVALVFSQVFFSPEPVGLLRRAESVALTGLASGVRQAARALSADDTEGGVQALRALRDLRDDLGELARLRVASPRIARHSAIWQSQATPAVRESEHADQLDLLASACIMLVRAALATGAPAREWLAPRVRALGDALDAMARAPAARDARQRAVDQALSAARQLATSDAPDDPALAGAVYVARIAAFDTMVFAGAPAAQTLDSILATTGELRVADRPSRTRLPFNIDGWRVWRRSGRRSRD